MANKRDYYEVLGIDKNATDEDIKRAYRKKAKECHPDLHPNDKEAEARFKELNEANEVLSDPDKRARYDQFGFDGPDMGGGAGGNPFGGMDFSGMGGMGDIFDQLFNGGMGGSAQARRNAPRQGNDVRYELRLTFEEAAKGCHKSVEFYRYENCATCGGSGAKPGTQPQTCSMCKGTGQIRQSGGRPCVPARLAAAQARSSRTSARPAAVRGAFGCAGRWNSMFPLVWMIISS